VHIDIKKDEHTLSATTKVIKPNGIKKSGIVKKKTNVYKPNSVDIEEVRLLLRQ
jgi:hypothetical protein